MPETQAKIKLFYEDERNIIRSLRSQTYTTEMAFREEREREKKKPFWKYIHA